MLSFFTFTLLAIAAQSLFTGVGAAVIPKRQDTNYPAVEPIKRLVAGPLNITVVLPIGGQVTDETTALLQQLIPTVLNDLTGLNNTVNFVGTNGLSPLSVGLGLSPLNGTTLGFDLTSILPQISETLSSVLNSTVTVLPIDLTTLSGLVDITLPIPSVPSITLPSVLPTDLLSGLPIALPSILPRDFSSVLPGVLATGLPSIGLPTGLPFPVASNVASFIQVELPPIVDSISQGLPSISSVLSPILALPTDISILAVSLPTAVSVSLPTDISVSLPADTSLPTDISVPLPRDISVSLPTDISVSLPTDILASLPTDISVSLPIDISVSLPTGIPTSVLNVPIPSIVGGL